MNGVLSVANIDTANPSQLYETWAILILPQLDQAPLYNTFDLTQSITSNTPNSTTPSKNNQTARGTNLAVMLCPSDTFNRTPFNGSSSASGLTSNCGDGSATRQLRRRRRDSGLMTNNNLDQFFDGADLTRTTGGWNGAGSGYVRGVMGANASMSSDRITDGTSNTILLGEIRAGITSFDCRGIWAMSGGPSAPLGPRLFRRRRRPELQDLVARRQHAKLQRRLGCLGRRAERRRCRHDLLQRQRQQ